MSDAPTFNLNPSAQWLTTDEQQYAFYYTVFIYLLTRTLSARHSAGLVCFAHVRTNNFEETKVMCIWKCEPVTEHGVGQVL